MIKRKIEIEVRECGLDELGEADRRLVDAARKATRGSYAPYSHFNVGAAILMDNGDIVVGANQENAAYPSGTCAERTAAFYASATHTGMRMRKIAVAARTGAIPATEKDFDDSFQKLPISPCGACRQALLEYEKPEEPIEVLLYGRDRILIFPSVASMLPYCFTDF